MSFTAHGPNFLGNAGTISFRTDDGKVIPIVSIIPGELNAFSEDVIAPVIANLVSVLNDQKPDRHVEVTAKKIGWERTTNCLDMYVRIADDMTKKTRLHMLFDKSAPTDLCELLYNSLAEEGGMGKVMDAFKIHLPFEPVKRPTARPNF